MSQNQTKKAEALDEDAAWRLGEEHIPWREQTTGHKIKTVSLAVLKIVLVLGFLYLFVSSLVLMSQALNVLAGRVAVDVFQTNVFLSNPVTGLIIGILVTVVIQSSSTTTSIVIAMVAAEVITVEKGIPIVMGANIGTSVTNTGVSFTLVMDRDEFRRAFAGATVHDCFNFLSVIVLLPLEAASGYLEALSGAVINSIGQIEGSAAPKFLRIITEPIVGNLIHVNKTVQKLLAKKDPAGINGSLIARWCGDETTYGNVTKLIDDYVTVSPNATASPNATTVQVTTIVYEEMEVKRRCDSSDFLFADTGLSEQAVGAILLIMALVILIVCLIGMVKVLTSSLKGSFKKVIRKAINTNFPSPFGWLSSYVAVFVGTGVTMVIQSSSVVTSTLTPLVGLGVVKLKRMYAVTVGANMGTTITGVLAALATGSTSSLQLAFCHFFFNITGFVLWYPIPFMRKIPMRAAKGLGNITSKYRWFAIFYVIMAFFLIPLTILGLSFAPLPVLITVLVIVGIIALFVIVVNILQTRRPKFLPKKLRSWDFLPLFMHSYKPLDRLIMKTCGLCPCCKCCRSHEEADMIVTSNGNVENGISAHESRF